MSARKQKKLLERLTSQYKDAVRNPELSKKKVRELYFQLNCLSSQIEKMGAEELALLDE